MKEGKHLSEWRSEATLLSSASPAFCFLNLEHLSSTTQHITTQSRPFSTTSNPKLQFLFPTTLCGQYNPHHCKTELLGKQKQKETKN